MQAYYDHVYYDLERQRAAHYDELCSALRAVPGIEVVVDRWVQVTDWRWNLIPSIAACEQAESTVMVDREVTHDAYRQSAAAGSSPSLTPDTISKIERRSTNAMTSCS